MASQYVNALHDSLLWGLSTSQQPVDKKTDEKTSDSAKVAVVK